MRIEGRGCIMALVEWADVGRGQGCKSRRFVVWLWLELGLLEVVLLGQTH